MNTELVNLERYIKDRENRLKDLVDLDDKVNRELFLEFCFKVRVCNGMGEVDELFVNYYPLMLKNAFCFVTTSHLLEEIQGYPKKYFEEIFEDMSKEIKSTCINEVEDVTSIASKYLELVHDRKIVVGYYLSLLSLISQNKKANFSGVCPEEVLKCNDSVKARYVYENLKEKIGQRIDYYRRAKARINGFALEYKKNSFYSYTHPFIQELIASLYDYYDPSDKDLRKLNMKLDDLRDEINEKMQSDVRRVFKKKNRLRSQFRNDFENEIFIGDGLADINSKIDRIKTYGGFADFDNRVICVEMSKVLDNTDAYLRNSRRKLRGTDNVIAMRKVADHALELCEKIDSILENTSDYNRIKISDGKVVSYRDLSKLLHSLREIDFAFDEIDEIKSKLIDIDKYLLGI